MLVIYRAVDLLKQLRPHVFSFAVLNSLEQQIFERRAFKQLAQHVVNPSSQSLAGSLQLLEQARVDLTFARLRSDEIPQMANFSLPYTMNASEALLDLVRVPWQIVIDHQMAALEVHAFACRIVSD